MRRLMGAESTIHCGGSVTSTKHAFGSFHLREKCTQGRSPPARPPARPSGNIYLSGDNVKNDVAPDLNIHSNIVYFSNVFRG